MIGKGFTESKTKKMMDRIRKVVGISVILVLLALLLGTMTSQNAVQADGTTFTVNSTADPGDGVCDGTECTLREVINAANASPGTDICCGDIEFSLNKAPKPTPTPTPTSMPKQSPPVPPECCWCIYDVDWWASPNEPPADLTSQEYFAIHTEEWLEAGHTEEFGDPIGTHVIPDPSFHQETALYGGPEDNGYPEAEWDLLDYPGAGRINEILGHIWLTGVGYWNSSFTLLNWKARFDWTTALGPLSIWAVTLEITATSGNAGWPFAVGNSWVSVDMSMVTPSPSTSYHKVVGEEVLPGPATSAAPGGVGDLECYKVETYSWDDANANGVPDPEELTLSGTKWYHNDYGCPIKSNAVPGALYDGWETQDLIWYCTNPPFPPDTNGVVSGTMMAASGEGSGEFPPGFIPCDEFGLGEWVWVWGYGFEHCKWYRIWIQPYAEDPCNVVEGQVLLLDQCPPGFPPDGIPIEVETGGDGTFGPIPIWQVPEDTTLICTLWEIVADKMNVEPGDDYDEGMYNADEDGLDAVACEGWGFHIFPEVLTIILLSLGLACIGGYWVVRRRKGPETNA